MRTVYEQLSDDATLWVPPVGRAEVRIVDQNRGTPFEKCNFHINIGRTNRALLCSRDTGGQCVICTSRDRALATGAHEAARALLAIPLIAVPILVVSPVPDSLRVRIWLAELPIAKQLLVMSILWPNLWAPTDGRNLIIFRQHFDDGAEVAAVFPALESSPIHVEDLHVPADWRAAWTLSVSAQATLLRPTGGYGRGIFPKMKKPKLVQTGELTV